MCCRCRCRLCCFSQASRSTKLLSAPSLNVNKAKDRWKNAGRAIVAPRHLSIVTELTSSQLATYIPYIPMARYPGKKSIRRSTKSPVLDHAANRSIFCIDPKDRSIFCIEHKDRSILPTKRKSTDCFAVSTLMIERSFQKRHRSIFFIEPKDRSILYLASYPGQAIFQSVWPGDEAMLYPDQKANDDNTQYYCACARHVVTPWHGGRGLDLAIFVHESLSSRRNSICSLLMNTFGRPRPPLL